MNKKHTVIKVKNSRQLENGFREWTQAIEREKHFTDNEAFTNLLRAKSTSISKYTDRVIVSFSDGSTLTFKL